MIAEKHYSDDPEFKMVVDTIEALLHNAQFTPSEIRQAALLACIHYEQKTVKEHISIPGNPYSYYTDVLNEYPIISTFNSLEKEVNELKRQVKSIKRNLHLHE